MGKKRDWERRNPVKVKEMKRMDYLKHADAYKARAMARHEKLKNTLAYKKRMAENLKKWRSKNWDRFLENAREYQKRARKQRPELYRAKYARKYKRIKADPERYKHHLEIQKRNGNTPKGKHRKHLCRVKRRNAVGSHTVDQWLARVEMFGWRCAYCKKTLTMQTLTKDHVIPLSKGGTDWASNVVPACKPCNCRKKDRQRF